VTRWRRLRALAATELRIQWRYAVPAALAGLAAAWAVLLKLLPEAAAQTAAPYLLFVETMTVGTLIAGALTVTERTSGTTAAVAVTPARPGERLAARLTPLAVLTTACAVPVLLAGRAGARLPAALAAVALAALLLLALAAAVAARHGSFIGFLTTLPWPLVPLLCVPLAVAVDLLGGPLWYAVPTTGALALLRGTQPPYPAPVVLGYLALWAAAACWVAVRSLAERPDLARPGRARAGGTLTGPLVFPRADLRNVARDAVLVPVVASPLLLGLALRFGYPPLESWVATIHGLDLVPYRPVLALLGVVLHVPVIFGMTGALVMLDDLEDGALQVIRVSPLGVARYLAYRLGAVTVAAIAGLAIAAPLSGMVPASAWAAAVLAVPLAPLFTLATLAVAGSRVQGVTASKALGLAAYLPLAAWWLIGPASWLLVPLPAYWVVRAWDDPHPAWLAGGALCCALWAVLLVRRACTRLMLP
jgi:fluoroquinolone transport system permease protein